MNAEGLSTYDIEMLYEQFEEKPDFDITYNYRHYIPPLTPMEDYFSPKKSKCAWIKIGEHGCCGEPCKDIFCNKHLWMRLSGSRIPLPCLVCGVGIINFEFICTASRLQKEKRQLGLLLAKEFENNDDWHFKTSSGNASGN